jgi:hypothetical protein
MESASLQTLPEEILLHILRFLRHVSNKFVKIESLHLVLSQKKHITFCNTFITYCDWIYVSDCPLSILRTVQNHYVNSNKLQNDSNAFVMIILCGIISYTDIFGGKCFNKQIPIILQPGCAFRKKIHAFQRYMLRDRFFVLSHLNKEHQLVIGERSSNTNIFPHVNGSRGKFVIIL